ncbi:WG repeat-containing protein [Psychrobacter urativorans]|uniref:WG repeat-containing protein n=1 Tax=Psychrobacter urativorans TaxID=45610 RepID=UPI00191B0480|nr:WG repeat-containing protein [Psychrobacter urativorans]
MVMIVRKLIQSAGVISTSAITLSISLFAVFVAITPAQATISCAGYLPNSYFERIDDNKEFAGKLIELADGTQQLEDLNGKVLLDGLTDGYILMNKYLWAQQDGKYGIVTASGEIVVPFAYDNIATELDIGTSFIVSINNDTNLSNGLAKQGIIDRNGYWVYPLQSQNNNQQQKKRRIDNGYGNYSQAQESFKPTKAVDAPLNLVSASISHAHYDSDTDRDYFLIKSLSSDNGNTNKADDAGESVTQSVLNRMGLLDDQGHWMIPQQYDALYPLNPCTGQPLYLQAVLTTAKQQQTALLDQHANIIIPFATNQNIELFTNSDKSPLFLRSTLIKGSSATGMTEDIKDDVVSAQIIDATGKLLLSSDAPIVKLLYHQLYAYQQAGKFGFINNRGKTILEPQFDSYRDDADKVWVEKNGEMVRLETLINLG